MKIQSQRLTFIGCEDSYKSSKIAIFGAPYDGTSSLKAGSRFAPSVMRNDSFGVETYSPYLDKDLSEVKVFDGGDLELSFGNPVKPLKEIEKYTNQLLTDKKIPLMIGGEHLVTLGAFKAVVKHYPDVCLVQFDAHTDLREDYLGEKLSHASVVKRIWDIIGDNRIYQYGIRSGEKEEFYWAKEHTCLNKFNFDNISSNLIALKNKPIYLTIDLDVLDPSEMCGTGTPEAGGVRFMELLKAVSEVAKYNIVACDINELSPEYDKSGASTALACKLLREILLQL
jgi:agmatinase